MVHTDLSFKHDYSIEIIDRLNGKMPDYYFPLTGLNGGHDGLMVQVTPDNGTPWLGMFAFGDFRNIFSGIYTMPVPSKLCIVSCGAGYMMDVNYPESAEEITCWPIKDVQISTELGIIMFADYTEITAYNSRGISWQTKRIALDGFTITENNGETLKGVFYDIPEHKDADFCIDIKTGKHIC